MAENIKKEELGFKGVRRIAQKTKVDVAVAESRVELGLGFWLEVFSERERVRG